MTAVQENTLVTDPPAQQLETERPRGDSAAASARSMIVFENVHKVYDPNVVALEAASFVIDKGEFVFVVGASGSGKSTVIRLLLKELEPHAGRYTNDLDEAIPGDEARTREVVERLHLPFELLSDAKLTFARVLHLPIFEVEGVTLIKRLTLIIADGRVEKVFYPVFPPDENAAEVIAWR